MAGVLENKRILVVEDIAENMRLFHIMLRLEGAQVLEAFNASIGIETARREHPDLILMDVHMPGMDGLEATRVLRSDPLTQKIPIVAVTASVMTDELSKARQAGCDGYIAKPVEPLTFAAEVAVYLSAKIAG